MPTTAKLTLTIRLTEAQLGYLAYRYPETDPEDALVLRLERERVAIAPFPSSSGCT